ncbi:MAG: DUF4494 domain-containing protein [Bacteroidota bacterium]|nr:DUF4494 domain-containing protein [Bacteroidota bacterium]
MHNWFECKVQYEKISPDDGKQKKSTDTYLVDAVNFTDAEARITQEVSPYMTGEYTIANIKRTRIYELFDAPTGDRWYRAKVIFVILDQEKGTEKKVPSTMLVQASDIQEALNRLEEGMKGTMSDYEVAMITDTPIMDVYPYAAVEGEPAASPE